MDFNEKRNLSIKIALKELLENIENNSPKVYSAYQEEAKYYDYRDNYERKYGLKEATDKVMYRKVYDALITDINSVKSIMGAGLDKYEEEQIAELLVILFYFRHENEVSLYRNGIDKKVSYKSNNAQLKSGNLLYKYDELLQSLFKIANEHRNQIKIIERKEERKALTDFYMQYLSPATQKVIKCLRSYDRQNFTSINESIEIWIFYNRQALKVMTDIENQSGNLFYAYGYFTVILESIRNIFTWLYLCRYGEVDIKAFFDQCLENLDKEKELGSDYDLIQNYGINLEIRGAQKERDIWFSIADWLADTKYSKEYKKGFYKEYDERYTFSDKKIMNEYELNKFFCEDKIERVDRFRTKKEYCIKIYNWYKNHHLKDFGCEEIIALKAIYRECFIYTDTPPELKKYGKIKSLLNTIEEGKFDDLLYMSELELFYWEKIRRGVNREKNYNQFYLLELKFDKLFYQFEKDVLNPKYMIGHYLSKWVRILSENTIAFLKSEL